MNETLNPPYYESTNQLLNCAFPDGVSEAEYWPLLAVLHQWMSFRPIAEILAGFTGKDYIYCLNDVMGFGMDPWPSDESIQQVIAKLRICGYEDWLREEDCAFGSWQSVERILTERANRVTQGSEVSRAAISLLPRIRPLIEGTDLQPGVLYGGLFLATPNWHNRFQIAPVYNQAGYYRVSRRYPSNQTTDETVNEAAMWTLLETFVATASR